MNLADASVTLPLRPCPWGQTAACGSQPEHASPGAGPARAAAGFCQISWARCDRPLSSGEMAPFLGGGEDIPRLLCSCSLPAPLSHSPHGCLFRLSCSASPRPQAHQHHCHVQLPWLLKVPVRCITGGGGGRATY